MTTHSEPLAIWPWPAPPEQLEVVRQAYLALGLDYSILPCPAVPGGPVRVLALGAPAPFLCDSAVIARPLALDSVLPGLRWVLTGDVNDTRGYMLVDQLTSLLGDGVKEIEDDGSEEFRPGASNKSRVAFR